MLLPAGGARKQDACRLRLVTILTRWQMLLPARIHTHRQERAHELASVSANQPQEQRDSGGARVSPDRRDPLAAPMPSRPAPIDDHALPSSPVPPPAPHLPQPHVPGAPGPHAPTALLTVSECRDGDWARDEACETPSHVADEDSRGRGREGGGGGRGQVTHGGGVGGHERLGYIEQILRRHQVC